MNQSTKTIVPIDPEVRLNQKDTVSLGRPDRLQLVGRPVTGIGTSETCRFSYSRDEENDGCSHTDTQTYQHFGWLPTDARGSASEVDLSITSSATRR